MPAKYEKLNAIQSFILQRRFHDAREYLAKHPDEQDLCNSKFNGELAIHMALRSRAPIDLVWPILRTYPKAKNVCNFDGYTPYDLAKGFYSGDFLNELKQDKSVGDFQHARSKCDNIFSLKPPGHTFLTDSKQDHTPSFIENILNTEDSKVGDKWSSKARLLNLEDAEEELISSRSERNYCDWAKK